MTKALKFPTLLAISGSFTSCSFNSSESLADSMLDSAVDNFTDSLFESSRSKKITSDTKRQQAGKPLKYFSSERRLNAARQDRFLDDLID